MTDEDLHQEVNRLRAEVDTLTRAVAQLIQSWRGQQQQPHLADPVFHWDQALLNEEPGFLRGADATFADWPGRPRPDLAPEFSYIPPRATEDVLPRGGRNPRIGCERYDSGTWVHGAPHDCPTWARR